MSGLWENVEVCVTGGAGFIGSNLVRHLLGHGARVRVIDNLSSGRMENLSFVDSSDYTDNFQFLESDIRDWTEMLNVTQGSQVIFHMAALGSVPASVERPEEANDINVMGSLNILRAAHQNGIPRVVVSSSSAIYGNDPALPKNEDMLPRPESPYATSKITMEYYAANFTQLYGVETAILRYFNVFGPHQDPNSQYAAVIPIFVDRLLENKPPIIFGDGEQTRDFIHVDDVVRANMAAAIAPASACGIPINIAGGRRISVNLLYETICNLLGSSLSPDYRAERPGDVMHSVADVERARKFLDFEQSIDVEGGLASSIEWYRRNLGRRS